MVVVGFWLIAYVFLILTFLWNFFQFYIGIKTVETSRLENWNLQMTKACVQIMEI